jgi:hypothetical protein
MDLFTFVGAAVILLGSLMVTNKSPLHYLYSGFAEGNIIPKSKIFFANLLIFIKKFKEIRWKK